ncbi:MAG: AbrB/MazE/SpoVT family DNA-binding domain-containing protein [Elusimicrobia bacterium]|nr:AbrB/MazE/SpoVT family DNA-binding domain-containing protein [Elusimicrobiota bacterium]
MSLYACPVGAKFQITLPKSIRLALGIKGKGDMVALNMEGAKITLAKARIEPEEPFSEEEWAKILAMSQEPANKSFSSGKAFLKDTRKITARIKKKHH